MEREKTFDYHKYNSEYKKEHYKHYTFRLRNGDPLVNILKDYQDESGVVSKLVVELLREYFRKE